MQPSDIIAAYAADLPQDRQWTAEETRTVMRRVAAGQARSWAQNVWARMLDGRNVALAAVHSGEATRAEANAALEELNAACLAQLDDLFHRISRNIGIDDPAEMEAFAAEVAEPFIQRYQAMTIATPLDAVGRA